MDYSIENTVISDDNKTITVFFSFDDGSDAVQVFPSTSKITDIIKWATDRCAFLEQRIITMQQQAEVLQEQLLEQELNNQ